MDAKSALISLQGSREWEFDRSYEIVDGGLGHTVELKNAEGKIVLVERGEMTFTDKAVHAMEAGAEGIIIYNNTKGRFFGNLDSEVPIPRRRFQRKKARGSRSF